MGIEIRAEFGRCVAVTRKAPWLRVAPTRARAFKPIGAHRSLSQENDNDNDKIGAYRSLAARAGQEE